MRSGFEICSRKTLIKEGVEQVFTPTLYSVKTKNIMIHHARKQPDSGSSPMLLLEEMLQNSEVKIERGGKQSLLSRGKTLDTGILMSKYEKI